MTSEKARLRIGHGPWALGANMPPWGRARDSFKTDIVVVGAGITGSLLAQHLTARGHRITVVDRLTPGQGSTAASTAMLQWEIDTSLTKLIGLYGVEKAVRAYRQSFAAVQGLGVRASELGINCCWCMRPALYLAGAGDRPDPVAEEYRARQAAGLPGVLLDAGKLLDVFGIARAAGIVSPGAAEVDPVRLAHGMLSHALRKGATLIHDDVEAFDFDSRHARVRLASGHEIEAAHLVLATGYAMPPFVHAPIHRMSASWAAVTGAGTALGFWRDRALVWEDATPYLYARTTSDDRILVGGEDERIDDPQRRDDLAPAKAAALHAKLEQLWGITLPPFESVWSAAFSETEDGLPLIGPVPGCPRAFAAYGYGGNGITFSYLASQMVGAMISGAGLVEFEIYALDRPPPLGSQREP